MTPTNTKETKMGFETRPKLKGKKLVDAIIKEVVLYLDCKMGYEELVESLLDRINSQETSTTD